MIQNHCVRKHHATVPPDQNMVHFTSLHSLKVHKELSVSYGQANKHSLYVLCQILSRFSSRCTAKTTLLNVFFIDKRSDKSLYL